ncbi:unnamed protein product [Parascedosporium putredinis]|uniref:S1-like domain-containing protein n=1 Tax=Parascedosporium putredinis TaxID=1442378 RepID=A0A9P1GV86_9PEZI|nr:unnamed protein product [Parascedosporium putredinis]CAI7987990.1 unnamed protein product [Parascedosporium putredinis]
MPPRSRAQITRALDSLDPPDSLEATQTLPNKSLVTVELDDRFRQTVWVERGNYVLLERYPPKEVEDEAVGKIINIAKDEKAWRKMPYWPKEFPKFQYPESDEEDESNAGKMPPSDSEDDA